MYKAGLVANTENYKEMEANFQNRYAGEDGPLRAIPLGDSKSSECAPMELNMIPVTPDAFFGGPRSGVGLPSPFSPVAPDKLGMFSPSSSTWAQSPHQETLVLHPDEMRAKLHKICESFKSKA